MALTARAIRKIADKALRDIFSRLKRDRFGGHQIDRRGAGGDQTDESRSTSSAIRSCSIQKARAARADT